MTFEKKNIKNKKYGMLYDDIEEKKEKCKMKKKTKKKNVEKSKITKISVITSYIKRQRLNWFGHVKRIETTNKTREIMDWQPERKRPKNAGNMA